MEKTNIKTKIKNFMPKNRAEWSYMANLIVLNYLIIAFLAIPFASAKMATIIQPNVVIKKIVETMVVEKEIEHEDVWVANRIVQAGLNPIEAMVTNFKESGATNNDNKWNTNANGSIDLGRWMINSIHYGKEWVNWKTGEKQVLALECVVNVKCSTDWAITKRLHDGNWSAWYGARAAGIK